ncbi:hypothetical protein MRB53_005522 [Persea americana]|uniref:Uncharacterized protein n=1 Tax=Persea americana TaxID=3435 RepID=A0ACC2MDR8_PERAE|nr:hypothetical protein MRB53_005522 [Persea americana]
MLATIFALKKDKGREYLGGSKFSMMRILTITLPKQALDSVSALDGTKDAFVAKISTRIYDDSTNDYASYKYSCAFSQIFPSQQLSSSFPSELDASFTIRTISTTYNYMHCN